MEIFGIRQSHLRFGFSAARETLRAIEVLSSPQHHAEQLSWVRQARPLVSRSLKAELRHFHFFFDGATEVFPAVWAPDRQTAFDADLNLLRRSSRAYADAALIRLSGERLISPGRLRALRKPAWYRSAAKRHSLQYPGCAAMLAEFVASPRDSLRRFCEMLQLFYDRVMEPLWGAIDARLLSDVEMRTGILRAHGLVAVMRTLSPQIAATRESARQCVIRIGDDEAAESLTDRSALTLTPSYFIRPHLQMFLMKQLGGLQCSLVYPLPGLTAKAKPIPDRRTTMRRLSALGEASRLRIVELLAQRDLSTRELAAFLRSSEPVVSRHLRRLHEAGIVERRRHSYFVLYALRRSALHELREVLDRL